MYNVYQLFLMNGKKIPFDIKRSTWGNFSITVDKVENIKFSAGAWYCDAFTLSENYEDLGYGKVGKYKKIGCSGCYQWLFTDNKKEYNERLLPQAKQKHDRGLTYQKAGKSYKCFYCSREIHKGEQYERYSMRRAGKNNMPINEVFCLGHRDEMREKIFQKPLHEIKYIELLEKWDKEIIV